MAVFVRFFRVAMLFFNVYDSYKILKVPPPSAQNKGRPSLRAMSQRKRDMKGCLAVWIVWSCFVTYERFAEAIISLFVPFYDEFKSLVMLFLIMTRARGAEPIYLHIIRPFLKPYTSTIDQLLDFAHVVGDVFLGLIALPFIYVVEWWQRRFGTEPETLDTETEASSSPLSPVPSTKPRPPVVRADSTKTVKPTSIPTSKSRQTTTSRPSTGNQKKVDQHKASHTPLTDQGNHNIAPVQDLPTIEKAQIDGLPVTDEWRQYPAFPSAYPPTPLTKQTEIVAAAAVISTTLYPPITEELAQPDFRQSLLPPHTNSNPNYAGDLSDDDNTDGVQTTDNKEITISVMEVEDFDESMEGADEFESEDEFNVTLRTPDPLRILTSLGLPNDELGDDVSPLSLPSRSSALSTSDHASSLRTPSAESTFSLDVPLERPMPSSRKRSRQPTTSNADARLRVSRVMNRNTAVKVARSTRSPTKRVVIQRHQQRALQNATSRPVDKPKSTEPEVESSLTMTASHDNEQLALKRRRVSLLPPKAVQVAQPTRRRVTVTRQTSPPKKVTRVVTTQRPLSRLQTKTTEKLASLSSREGSPEPED